MMVMMMMMTMTMTITLRLQAWVRAGSGRMLPYVWNQRTSDASTETSKSRTFPDATQQPGLWAAHPH